jgi:hypothetical protein
LEATEHIESLLPNAKPFSDHGGHLGHWEHSQKVSDVILEFAAKAFENSTKNIPAHASSPGLPLRNN